MCVMMKCGHTANAKDEKGNPVCAICYRENKDAVIVNEKQPNLMGRKARCWQCGDIAPSNYLLPFFKYNENGEKDSYYCGCRGWD